MFLDALDISDLEDTSEFSIYKVSGKFAKDINHFDIVIVTSSGVICSSCNEYLEYGFYDRHILALFIYGFIDLHPLHQCSEFWLKSYSGSATLTVSWPLQVQPPKQSYQFHNVFSRFDTAFTLTASTYDKVKNPFETVTLETAMKFVSVQDVRRERQVDVKKQCLRDLSTLKMENDDELMEQLVELTRRAKEKLSKQKRPSIYITEDSGREVELIQPQLYKTSRQQTKRQRIGETQRTSSTSVKPSVMQKVYSAFFS
jgi:hypothetical protein